MCPIADLDVTRKKTLKQERKAMTRLEAVRQIIELSREAQRMEEVARASQDRETALGTQELFFWSNVSDIVHVCSCDVVRKLEESLSE